jgi:hypothetical protein
MGRAYHECELDYRCYERANASKNIIDECLNPMKPEDEKQILMVLMDGCDHCREQEKRVKELLKDFPNWKFDVILSSSEQGKMLMKEFGFSMGPAIFVQDKLFATGAFETEAFVDLLNKAY